MRDIFDFEIITGDDFYYTFVFFMDDDITPKDLTGYTFKCNIKDKYDNSLIYNITSINTVDNKVTIHISSDDTRSFEDLLDETNELKAVYDLEITIPNTEPQFPNGAIRSTPKNDVIIKRDVTT